MEESADAKEDDGKKILHTYPLVRVSVRFYNQKLYKHRRMT